MLRMLLRFTALVSLLFLSITAQAQRTPRVAPIPLQVHGQIRYAQGGRPAEFILVRLENFGGGIAGETTTDRTGNFRFSGLSADLYIVSVRTAGFREVQQQVDLRTQLSDYVQLQLVAADTSSNSSLPPKQGGVIDANVPQQARAEFERGRVALLEANNTDEGILHLESAVRLYPKYLEAMQLLGTAYMDKRDWDKAESTLRQVLVLDPRTTVAYFALGDLYLRQKKYSRAEQDLLAGINLDAKSVQGHFMLGRLYYELGDLPKAGPHVGTALQLNPKFAQGYLLAGNIYLRARQAENALVEFEEYLHLEPNGEFSEQAKEAVQRIRQALAKR
jgi:Tfp pilus assembly protein PilF